jgi:GNAT superfamily N-acetyltransferase
MIRPFEDGDVAALHTLAGAGSIAELRANLTDAGRDFGRRVVIVEESGAVIGGAGWVEAPPNCYGAPVIARDARVAALLVAHVIDRARACGASRLRISAHPHEDGKRVALEGAGFAPQFDFVTVQRRDPAGRETSMPRIAHAAIDPARFTDAYNDTFAGVPNVEPLSPEEVARLLAHELTHRDATAAYGDYDGFVHVERDTDEDGPHAIIAAIGVRAAQRRRGLAGAILDDALARMTEPACRALIASTNAASLALHASRGFRELRRRTVWELVIRA